MSEVHALYEKKHTLEYVSKYATYSSTDENVSVGLIHPVTTIRTSLEVWQGDLV